MLEAGEAGPSEAPSVARGPCLESLIDRQVAALAVDLHVSPLQGEARSPVVEARGGGPRRISVAVVTGAILELSVVGVVRGMARPTCSVEPQERPLQALSPSLGGQHVR